MNSNVFTPLHNDKMGFYVYTEKTSHIFYFTFASWWILSVYISVFFSIDIAHLFMFMLSSHIYYSVLSYQLASRKQDWWGRVTKKNHFYRYRLHPPHKIHHFVTKKTSTPPKPPTSRFFSLFFDTFPYLTNLASSS